MNSQFVMDSAERTAKRLCSDETQVCRKLIEDVYLAILSRQPTQPEFEQALSYLEIADGCATIADENKKQTKLPDSLEQRMARLIHVLFASTEFRMLN
jgi:hypothetical protein